MPTAIRTGRSWSSEYPTLAALPTQSKVAKAPTPTITMLASQGVSLLRAQLASCPKRPEGEPVAAAGWLSFASCFWLDRATATVAVIRPPSVASDHCPGRPKPKKCTTVPTAPLLWYSHAMAAGVTSISTAMAAVTAAVQPTQRPPPPPRPGLPDTSVIHQ